MVRVTRRVVGVLLTALLLVGCSGNDGHFDLQNTPAAMTFSVTVLHFGGHEVTRQVSLDPTGTAVAWTLVPSDRWLQTTPATGTGPATVTVTVDRAGLDPGTYTASLRLVTARGSLLLPVTVDVLGGAGPQLAVSPASLDFGAAASSLTCELTNAAGGGTLSWSATELVSWATVTPRSGTGPATLTVTVDRAVLPAGTASGYLRVTSNGGTASIPLRVVVGGAASPSDAAPLTVAPAAVVFPSGSSSVPVTLTAASSGLAWTVAASATWLSVTPAAGMGSGEVTIGLDRSQLGEGLNAATVTVRYSGDASGAIDLPVSVVVGVAGPLPQLAVSPASLTFAPDQTSKPLSITNLGAGDLVWAINTSAPWLTAQPSSGTGAATVIITVDRASLTGPTGTVTVIANGGTASLPVAVLDSPGG